MSFIDDGQQSAQPFLETEGNFLANDPSTFMLDSDDWSDMSGWKTFWMSTFDPKKYKNRRDDEVRDGLKAQYNVSSSMNCSKLNSTIDKMSGRMDSEANASPDKRGGRRMQGRVLKGLEPVLDKAYNLAESKCCEYSVCDSNKTRGRDDEEDTYDSGSSSDSSSGSSSGSSNSLPFKNTSISDMKDDIMKELQRSLVQPAPAVTDEGMSMGAKIGLGMGGFTILFGMGYLMFKS